MVFQYPEYQLFAETVFEDVAFGLKNYYKNLYKKQKTKPDKEWLAQEIENKVKEAITMVGLNYEEVKNKSPFDLSGGQKRRAAIAGVIVTKPEILILDEPTAGLDPRGKSEIIALIHHLKQSCSPTVIMISHDMGEIAQNCNKIAVIQDGKILCVKAPRELFGDKKLIEGTGLDIPESVKLKNMLKENGYDFEDMPFSPRQTAESLLKLIKSAGGNYA
jgi:energy-coupling factor transport system ATP-binding protein